MTECSIVKDLLPLYVEDMVSAETAEFIRLHLEGCESCRSELDLLSSDTDPEEMTTREISPESDGLFKKTMKRLKGKFHILSYTLVVLFVVLGFAWTNSDTLMLNSLLMPIVGIFGYAVFGWRSVYKMPAILFGIDLFASLLGLVEMDIPSALLWSFIYGIFVLIGVAIAFLFHFAFRRENKE